MEFTRHKAIYLQIADYIGEKILTKQWANGERIASVRELSVALEVNPNTVMRAYDYLDANGIISNRRGIGFFLTDDARKKTTALFKEIFISETMPALFKNMYVLQISPDEIAAKYAKFCTKQTN